MHIIFLVSTLGCIAGIFTFIVGCFLIDQIRETVTIVGAVMTLVSIFLGFGLLASITTEEKIYIEEPVSVVSNDEYVVVIDKHNNTIVTDKALIVNGVKNGQRVSIKVVSGINLYGSEFRPSQRTIVVDGPTEKKE